MHMGTIYVFRTGILEQNCHHFQIISGTCSNYVMQSSMRLMPAVWHMHSSNCRNTWIYESRFGRGTARIISISNDNKLSNSATAKQIRLVTAQEISNICDSEASTCSLEKRSKGSVSSAV